MDIKTEDGKRVAEGDVVYNYYDMVPCAIRSQPDDEGWFYVENLKGYGDRGTSTYTLDGSRICTLDFAIQRGFKGAAEAKKSLPMHVLVENVDGTISVYGPFPDADAAWEYRKPLLDEWCNGGPYDPEDPNHMKVEYDDPGLHDAHYEVVQTVAPTRPL